MVKIPSQLGLALKEGALKLNKFMNIRLLLIPLFLLGFFRQINPAYALSPVGPSDYKQLSENGQYAFVMLIPENMTGMYRARTDSDLRATYKQSGMYDAKTNILLWTVSWYSYRVTVLNDGEHLINWGLFNLRLDARNIGNVGSVVSFCKNGNCRKGLFMSDLTSYYPDYDDYPDYDNLATEVYVEDHIVDELTKEISVKTNRGDIYILNYSSGELVLKATHTLNASITQHTKSGNLILCAMIIIMYSGVKLKRLHTQ